MTNHSAHALIDPSILAIIKAMAKGDLAEDNATGLYCVHCDNTQWTQPQQNIEVEHITHKPDCPILAARRLLISWGMPLNIYRISGEARRFGECWQPIAFYETGYSDQKEEFSHLYDGHENKLFNSPNHRNMTITLVRQFPVEEVE